MLEMESNMRLKYRDLVRFYQILLFSPLFCPGRKLRLRSKIFQIEDRKMKIILERSGRTECISMCLIKVNKHIYLKDGNITIIKENLIIISKISYLHIYYIFTFLADTFKKVGVPNIISKTSFHQWMTIENILRI